MQTTTAEYDELQNNPVRQLDWNLAISFDKQLDPSITYFILDTSLLDGNDLLAPDDDNPITEWDKYIYTDYSDRVLALEWTDETSLLTSITASIADITLNNFDNYFTPLSDSPIAEYLIPRRPMRIQSGFLSSLLPQFIGITTNSPSVDRQARTAKLHAQDFLRYIFDKKLDQTEMIIDKRVDEIISQLFQDQGVLPDQMELDYAMTTVPFAFFTTDDTVGGIVQDLMKAEMGSLYMDERGIIVFKNRLRSAGDVVASFDQTNVIDYDTSDESNIINSVKVNAEVRIVQPIDVVFALSEVIELAAGATVSKFFQFQDPVVDIETIESYTANTAEDGNGSDVSALVDITATNFNTAVLVEIENTSSETAYVTGLNIYGTPAKIARTVSLVEKDQDSIDKFEEQVYTLESKFIQDASTAQSIALTLIRHFKDYGNTITIQIKAQPALQISDLIHIELDGINDDFRIIKKAAVIANGEYRHKITAQKYDIPSYFILDESLLDGSDVLAA